MFRARDCIAKIDIEDVMECLCAELRCHEISEEAFIQQVMALGFSRADAQFEADQIHIAGGERE
jgi:hypothetical protein